MRRIIITFILLLAISYAHGQSTANLLDSARYQLMDEEDFHRGNFYKFDTYTGKLKLIKVSHPNNPSDTKVIIINDQDLAAGGPYKAGRFRILRNRENVWGALVIDTENGRVWQVYVNTNTFKSVFEQVDN